MALRAHGSIAAARLADLSAWVSAPRTTEQVVQAALGADLTIADVVWMDEFTLDLIVPLPDGLVLVYDTT